ncbi:hypothetical protein GOBAR_AA31956 [Gossypium barbadense]|uniref:F-box domain-containing protein n=1 Tax=Gossypium barbadense TaxID=3634 RepID=A0A2P5WCA9_GOSBA|nr:hypothetical protein GOBAR_AA31956 [Gossypium barbadense]
MAVQDLPDELLCHILSFLPSHYSIRISCLSTRFRYLWRSVPILDLPENHYNSSYPFDGIMNHVLNNHENLTSVRRIFLSLETATYNKSVISEWIHLSTTATSSNLEEKLKTQNFFKGVLVDKIPTDVRVFFPCLETARLESVPLVGDNTLSKFFFRCPQFRIFDVENYVLHSDKIPLSATVTVKKLYVEYHEDCDSNRVPSQASASIDVTESSKDAFDILKFISTMIKHLEKKVRFPNYICNI